MTSGVAGEWFALREAAGISSPSVIVYRDRLETNIDTALELAGGPERLRPHIKTHKSADVVALHLDRGITRFKCATIAEAAMLTRAGATDVMVAYQPVGPFADRLFDLIRKHRNVRFSCLVDSPAVSGVLETLAERYGIVLRVCVDLDVGMHRTGIAPGDAADDLYAHIASSRWLEAAGVHAYDGHSRASDPGQREGQAAAARGLALSMKRRLESRGFAVPEVVLGGTPPFPLHARAVNAAASDSGAGTTPRFAGVTLSPGTYSYFDWGSARDFPDLPFRAAALVLGRVISAPSPGRFTIDVGAKAICADPPQPRGTLLNLPDAQAGPQSEEHWVFTIDPQSTPSPGAAVYVWPRHICTTIEHYDHVLVAGEDRSIIDSWDVGARTR